jgi:hypothetical protein
MQSGQTRAQVTYLRDLVLDDALLQFGEQRLGLGQGEPNALAAEVVEAAAKDADFVGRHLAPIGARFKPDRPFHGTPFRPPEVARVSRPARPDHVFSTPGTVLMRW